MLGTTKARPCDWARYLPRPNPPCSRLPNRTATLCDDSNFPQERAGPAGSAPRSRRGVRPPDLRRPSGGTRGRRPHASRESVSSSTAPGSVRLLEEGCAAMAELDSRPHHGDRRAVLAFAIVGLVLGIGGGVGLGAATRSTPASATVGTSGAGTALSPTTTTVPAASGSAPQRRPRDGDEGHGAGVRAPGTRRRR